jgi:DNA-directed RNA polymerase specialized sigma24 family protein
VRLTLGDLAASATETPASEAAAVFEVMDRLGGLDARKGEIAQLRILWGLEMAEIADTLEVSLATVERDWRFSRAWLARELAVT